VASGKGRKGYNNNVRRRKGKGKAPSHAKKKTTIVRKKKKKTWGKKRNKLRSYDKGGPRLLHLGWETEHSWGGRKCGGDMLSSLEKGQDMNYARKGK